LRKAIWQIQAVLEGQPLSLDCRVLRAEPDWVQINPEMDLWLDIGEFERIFGLVQGLRGADLDPRRFEALQSAVELYRGDLLEGCYRDWCIYERERFQHMYLAMLDKLMDHCEAHCRYEVGLTYGIIVLRYDRARERTHRQLMRLYYLSQNRTAALRQYERCVAALIEELSVKPTKQTVALYEQIRADRLGWSFPTIEGGQTISRTIVGQLLEFLSHLKRVQTVLLEAQHQMEQDIEVVELALGRKR
jgi:DNA-binding SARP family transcriptional activator